MDDPLPSMSRNGTSDDTMSKQTSPSDPPQPESPPKSASSLARSGTLSWQQRPTSGSIRRPLSVASRASVVSDKPAEEQAEPTRNQIAESLVSKDPSWFKQTADRGIGNAAFRRNQEEPEEDSVRKFGLPGMSPPPSSDVNTIGGTISPPPDSLRSSSPSRGSATWSNRFSTATSNSTYSTTEQKPAQGILDPPKLTPSATDPAASARSASPTRGAGGFVQSAMMKRSDSVNKRWSAQQGGGLSRHNSAASLSRGNSGSSSMPRLDQSSSSLSRETSAEASSRPSSSYSNQTITQDAGEKRTDDGFVRPQLPMHTRSKSTMSLSSNYENAEDSDRPSSPSKRWSPTKSSWLESAINRPESPRVPSPTKDMPSWMVELNKSKQQKTNGSVPASPSLDTKQGSPSLQNPTMGGAEKVRSASPEQAVKTSPTEDPEMQNLTTSRSSPLEKAKTSALEPKAKPDTPPKKDFRANLKPRETPKTASDKGEPEFRNALGKLRKAETKNYVAPDTFTNNIKAGKAALTITGGVPERVRRDELKESLVAQKEAMKAKKEAEPDKPTSGVAIAPPKDKPMPEFLAAKQRMGGKPPVGEKSKAASAAAQSPPTSQGVSRTWSKPDPSYESKQSTPFTSKPSQFSTPSKATPVASPTDTPSGLKSGVSSKLAERFNPGLAGMLARGPPSASGAKSGASSSVEDLSASPSLSRVQSAEPKDSGPLEHKTKSRARGPKRRAPATKAAEPAEAESTHPEPLPKANKNAGHFRQVSLVKQELVLGSNAPVADLSSKEQMPENVTSTAEQDNYGSQGRGASPQLERLPDASAVGGFEFGFGDTQAGSQSKVEPQPGTQAETEEAPRKPYSSLNKGGTASFADQIAARVGGPPQVSPSLGATKPVSASQAPTTVPSRGQFTPEQSKQVVGSLAARSPSPDKSQARPASPEKPEAAGGPSVRNAAAIWGRSTNSAASSPKTGPSSPIKLPNQRDEEEAKRNAGLAPGPESPKRGLGLGAAFREKEGSTSSVTKTEPTKPRAQFPMAPPTTTGPDLASTKIRSKSPALAGSNSASPSSTKRSRPPSIMLKKPPESPVPQTSEASKLFSDFFDHRPIMPQSVDVDTQALITNYPVDTSKVRTLRKQIQEISSDGKAVTLPSNEEYTLFEGAMYTIAHSFERSAGGKASEAYLWVGNDVPQSAAEDVQVFAKRFAKDNKATLEVVQQGKESSAFLQALGGILITRRGSRSQRNSTQQFMLCGRRHLGHIAFDEVDLSLRTFSSGFPFLVFANGKLHLWRGTGSTVEEISCARLIAMDIGITPDVIEVEEGKEPATFVNLFPSPEKGPKKIFPSADHWQRKANSERYRTRLFHINTSTPQQQQPQGGFQVSSLWPPSFMGRRPSASSLQSPTTPTSSSSNRSSPFPQTPTMPKATSPAAPLDPNAPVSAVEIAPYTQRDMEGTDGVFVLDAFFEVYM